MSSRCVLVENQSGSLTCVCHCNVLLIPQIFLDSQIDPDYVDYFYNDLIPNLHYVPASLENITDVARYVVDPKNDEEMRNVVKAANSWCKRVVTEEVLVRDAMFQLDELESALVAYEERNNWVDDWRKFRMAGVVDDWVDCSVNMHCSII